MAFERQWRHAMERQVAGVHDALVGERDDDVADCVTSAQVLEPDLAVAQVQRQASLERDIRQSQLDAFSLRHQVRDHRLQPFQGRKSVADLFRSCVDVADDARLREQRVAQRVVDVMVTVYQQADGLVGDAFDLCLKRLRHRRREHRIDRDAAIRPDDQPGV